MRDRKTKYATEEERRKQQKACRENIEKELNELRDLKNPLNIKPMMHLWCCELS